jgi:cytochrome c oxidase subunit 3
MSLDNSLLTPDEAADLGRTVLVRRRLEGQYEDLEQQHGTAALGMWVFLATEVMFFGTLFLGLTVYHYRYPEAFEKASERLNWQIGGGNTIVLLVSSLMMVLAVHYARAGLRKHVVAYLGLTALLGLVFLGLKALEYYLDYRENLIPGWKFESQEWLAVGLSPEQVPHVKLFLLFYWVMTGLHALHMILGITAVLVLLVLTWRGFFSPEYYSPIDVTALYWHFVDTVWIFLLPMLYLLGTHTL